MRYACNCGRAFHEPEDRTVHMTTCPVMNAVELQARLTRAQKALEIADKIIDALRDYSVGMSFLSEEKVQVLVTEYRAELDAVLKSF